MHVLAADGAFLPNGRFVALPRVPEKLPAEGFRRAVLEAHEAPDNSCHAPAAGIDCSVIHR
jgi:hypothetical protein